MNATQGECSTEASTGFVAMWQFTMVPSVEGLKVARIAETANQRNKRTCIS